MFELNRLISLYPRGYLHQKRYFENYYMRLFEQCSFVKEDDDGLVEIVSKSLLKHQFGSVPTLGDKKKGFLGKWLADHTAKTVRSTVYIPCNIAGEVELDDDVVNVYRPSGFKYVQVGENERDLLLRDFLGIALELFEGKQDVFVDMMKIFARMVQKPCEPCGYIIAFVNAPKGCGKDVFFDTFKYLFGESNVLKTSKPQHVFGEHAEPKARMIILNEAVGSSFKSIRSHLKHFATSSEIVVNPKGRPIYTMKNYANMFIVTNDRDYYIDGHGRRDIIFRPTTKYCDTRIYNTEFWSNLVDLIQTDRFLSALRDYFFSIDIENVDWHALRVGCLTDTYYEYVERSFDPFIRFLFENFYIFTNNLTLAQCEYVPKPNGSRDVTINIQRFEILMRDFGFQYPSRDAILGIECVRMVKDASYTQYLSFNTKNLYDYILGNYYIHRIEPI